MRDKYKLIFIFLLMASTMVACNSSKASDNKKIEEEKEVVIEVEPVEPEEIVEEKPEEKEGIPSPISGIYGPEDRINRRVVGVMFDNHPRARWQAGLKDAEIVYEFQVEAPYTRYLGLFLANDPPSLGPIRSSRPYFVTVILEYDAVYARVGGSEAAKADIRNFAIADIDGLSSGSNVFWRSSSKRMPHNLYSSMEVLRKIQEERGYKPLGDNPEIIFHEEDKDIEGSKASTIDINYGNGNTTGYRYDPHEKLYLRQKDGVDHIDEVDKSQLKAKNIIIQEVNTRVIDNEGRLQIDLVGEGRGKYISNGSLMDIKWIKKDRRAKTKYYGENGQELILNPGITWIQMVRPKMEITIE